MAPDIADITIVGAGLLAARQLGQAANDVVRSARVVFCSTTNIGIADYVRAVNPTAEIRFSEKNEYQVGMYRPDMYRRMAQVVVDAARAGPGVVMLAPGSAVVVDAVTQCILDAAASDGLRVRLLPGISSIEAVLAQVGYDVSRGLGIFLAQNLVLHRLQIDPSIASIVLQPAYFDTLFFAGAPRSLAGRFDALEEQLARTLTRDAPMALVITANEEDGRPSVFWFRLGALGRLHRVLSPRHTLFVPPARPVVSNDAFATRIASWDACRARIDVDDNGTIRQMQRREIQGRALDSDSDQDKEREGDVPSDLRQESTALAERWRLRRG